MKSNRSYIKNKISPKPKKRKKKAGRAKKNVLFCAAAVASCVLLCCAVKGAYGWLCHSDYFTLKQVKVYGCSITTPEQIRSQTMIQEGTNILSIDLSEESTRLKQHSWICRALIRRKLPDTIEIYVTERTAVAVAELDGPYFVDTHGDLFAKTNGRKNRLPRIVGITRNTIDDKSTPAYKLLKSSLELIGLMKKTGFPCGSHTTLTLNTVLGITVTCSRLDLSIAVGHDHFREKLALLGRILKDLDQRGVQARAVNIASPAKAYVTIEGQFGPAGRQTKKNPVTVSGIYSRTAHRQSSL